MPKLGPKPQVKNPERSADRLFFLSRNVKLALGGGGDDVTLGLSVLGEANGGMWRIVLPKRSRWSVKPELLLDHRVQLTRTAASGVLPSSIFMKKKKQKKKLVVEPH